VIAQILEGLMKLFEYGRVIRIFETSANQIIGGVAEGV
jgi:hypothetical protein